MRKDSGKGMEGVSTEISLSNIWQTACKSILSMGQCLELIFFEEAKGLSKTDFKVL
jgi:hypothetical protein